MANIFYTDVLIDDLHRLSADKIFYIDNGKRTEFSLKDFLAKCHVLQNTYISISQHIAYKNYPYLDLKKYNITHSFDNGRTFGMFNGGFMFRLRLYPFHISNTRLYIRDTSTDWVQINKTPGVNGSESKTILLDFNKTESNKNQRLIFQHYTDSYRIIMPNEYQFVNEFEIPTQYSIARGNATISNINFTFSIPDFGSVSSPTELAKNFFNSSEIKQSLYYDIEFVITAGMIGSNTISGSTNLSWTWTRTVNNSDSEYKISTLNEYTKLILE